MSERLLKAIAQRLGVPAEPEKPCWPDTWFDGLEEPTGDRAAPQPLFCSRCHWHKSMCRC